jgi:hypothetical protein
MKRDNLVVIAYTALVGGSILATVLASVALVGGFILALNVVPWLLWNHAVAPTFGWPHVGFWKCFFLMWAFGIVCRIIRGSR